MRTGQRRFTQVNGGRREADSSPHMHRERRRVGGQTWHLQILGEGPPVLMLHGCGASADSWRGLARLLADQFEIICPDLPGHGLSAAANAAPSLDELSLRTMDLLGSLAVTPCMLVGHSAGAAIALNLCLRSHLQPRAVVSINGALRPLQGVAGSVCSPLARAIAQSRSLARLCASIASTGPVLDRLLRSTGSQVDEESRRIYAALVRRPGHVRATIDMMAHWDLVPLANSLSSLSPRLLLIAGAADAMVPARDALWVQSRVADSKVVVLPGLGHLAHEERPALVQAPIMALARQTGLVDDERERRARVATGL
ncbi:MAG: alpha/beta fold hydrolase [Gammaproteobacteria bacterium]|nr:alpha/beta fold hydrolase [Gammaproteobacteria bacterium]